MDRNGEFQLEFSLSKIRSTYEHKFRISQSIFANASRMAKLETSYFTFGNYDWSLSIYPSGRSDSQLGTGDGGTPLTPTGSSSMAVYLNRHTGLDRSCRVKFNMRVGEGESVTEAGVRDEISDCDGRSFGWNPR